MKDIHDVECAIRRIGECSCGAQILAERDALKKALEVAMAHIESDSCGKEPYRGNTIWRVRDALGLNKPAPEGEGK